MNTGVRKGEADWHIPKEGVHLNEPCWRGGGRTGARVPSSVDSLLRDLECCVGSG